MNPKKKVFLALVTVLSTLSVACGSDDTDAAAQRTPRAQPSAEATEAPEATGAAPSHEGHQKATRVQIIDTDFREPSVTIDAGSKIKWTQIGDQPHSVTAADGSFDSSPDCGPLESDMCLGMDDKFEHVFDKPGTYVYYCRVHGLPDGTGMVGEIVVK